jgi:hypothetical protein
MNLYAITFTNRWTDRKMIYPQVFESHTEADKFLRKEILSHLYSSKNWKDHKTVSLLNAG